MKPIRIFKLGIAICAISISGNAVSQEIPYSASKGISVQVEDLTQRGDSLYLKMKLSAKERILGKRVENSDFVPVLTYGKRSKEMPYVSIMSRIGYRNYSRSLAIMDRYDKESLADYMPYAVLKDFGEQQNVYYEYTMLYEPWMAWATLELRTKDCGCGKATPRDTMILSDRVNLEPVEMIEPYIVRPSIAYLRPEAEPIKSRSVQAEAFLDFEVGKTTLKPSLGNNAQELEKIILTFEDVRNDKDVTLNGISLSGYASPEGSETLNNTLAEGRVKSLDNFLKKKFEYDDSFCTLNFEGEDWTTLTQLINESDMPSKLKVLDIIVATEDADEREKQLKSLDGGKPYKYLLQHFFPQLRRVIFKADYNVRQFNVDEAKEVVKTRPQNLSLNEMFLVANTYEIGSEEFNELFETAVKVFPDDATANINAAVTSIAIGDYESAAKYLDKVKIRKRIPEYDNAKGLVLLVKDSDFDKAEIYFRSASEAGLQAASENLEEVYRAKDNFERRKAAKEKAEEKAAAEAAAKISEVSIID